MPVVTRPEPRFLPCGDLAVSVELGDEISREVNARVLALEYLIRQTGLAGVSETVPSFRSLLVYYDPLVVGFDALCAALRGLAAEARPDVLPPARTVELPCCYGGELGFELEAAAAKLGLAPDEVARLHASADYYVFFVGFTPGLPYMTGMPERLTIPRLPTPRTNTPPGSVGIGGTQCCIYSVESPGGFWVLGRTPLRLYDPAAPDPILLRAGDRVRFRLIDRAEFDAIAAQVAAGTYGQRSGQGEPRRAARPGERIWESPEQSGQGEPGRVARRGERIWESPEQSEEGAR
ncbi:MAG: 5-oxoprolinase subunit PxpB [Candidatus Rokubacteria bacterium]|nr:5-oxoprolinase subunit PxpB [Candidatus Rokubacteria bacterium]MBI3106027.1 5-oxoprolinase subunit PxpB [Candidatus Rokubacteria bacterium]